MRWCENLLGNIQLCSRKSWRYVKIYFQSDFVVPFLICMQTIIEMEKIPDGNIAVFLWTVSGDVSLQAYMQKLFSGCSVSFSSKMVSRSRTSMCAHGCFEKSQALLRIQIFLFISHVWQYDLISWHFAPKTAFLTSG